MEFTSKVNWDVVVDAKANFTGLGGISRDSKGEVHVSYCSILTFAMKHELAKAMALRKSMTTCMELGLSPI